jgi:hypothetical protein
VNIGDDQTVDRVRHGIEIQHSVKVIEPAGLEITHELYVVDMPEAIAVTPTRRRRGKKTKALTPEMIRVDTLWRGHTAIYNLLFELN